MVTNATWKVIQSITISLLCLLSLVESQNLTVSQRFSGGVGGTLLDSASASVATDGLRNNTYILTHKGIYVYDHNTNVTYAIYSSGSAPFLQLRGGASISVNQHGIAFFATLMATGSTQLCAVSYCNSSCSITGIQGPVCLGTMLDIPDNRDARNFVIRNVAAGHSEVFWFASDVSGGTALKFVNSTSNVLASLSASSFYLVPSRWNESASLYASFASGHIWSYLRNDSGWYATVVRRDLSFQVADYVGPANFTSVGLLPTFDGFSGTDNVVYLAYQHFSSCCNASNLPTPYCTLSIPYPKYLPAWPKASGSNFVGLSFGVACGSSGSGDTNQAHGGETAVFAVEPRSFNGGTAILAPYDNYNTANGYFVLGWTGGFTPVQSYNAGSPQFSLVSSSTRDKLLAITATSTIALNSYQNGAGVVNSFPPLPLRSAPVCGSTSHPFNGHRLSSSPDGYYTASISPYNSQSSLFVGDIRTSSVQQLVLPEPDDVGKYFTISEIPRDPRLNSTISVFQGHRMSDGRWEIWAVFDNGRETPRILSPSTQCNFPTTFTFESSTYNVSFLVGASPTGALLVADWNAFTLDWLRDSNTGVPVNSTASNFQGGSVRGHVIVSSKGSTLPAVLYVYNSTISNRNLLYALPIPPSRPATWLDLQYKIAISTDRTSMWIAELSTGSWGLWRFDLLALTVEGLSAFVTGGVGDVMLEPVEDSGFAILYYGTLRILTADGSVGYITAQGIASCGNEFLVPIPEPVRSAAQLEFLFIACNGTYGLSKRPTQLATIPLSTGPTGSPTKGVWLLNPSRTPSGTYLGSYVTTPGNYFTTFRLLLKPNNQTVIIQRSGATSGTGPTPLCCASFQSGGFTFAAIPSTSGVKLTDGEDFQLVQNFVPQQVSTHFSRTKLSFTGNMTASPPSSQYPSGIARTDVFEANINITGCISSSSCFSGFECTNGQCVVIASPIAPPAAIPMAPPSLLATPTSLSCRPPIPAIGAQCVNGVWNLPSVDVTDSGVNSTLGSSPGPLNVSSNTIITGDLLVTVSNSTVAVVITSGSTLTVDGCVSLSGVLLLEMTQEVLSTKTGNLTVLNYQTICDPTKSKFSGIQVRAPSLDSCSSVTFNSSYSARSLSIAFAVTDSCNSVSAGRVNVGLVVGLVFAGVFIVLIIVVGVIFWRRRRNEKFRAKFGDVVAQDERATRLDEPTEKPSARKKGDTEYTSIRLESDLPSMESIVGESASVLTIPSSEITILGELGKGSFGTVHLGMYQDSFCAVKTLTNQSKSASDDFINEATLMHSLKKHVFLVEMMGLCMEAGKYSVVMEFCPRGNVESLLKSRMSERKSIAPKLEGYTLFKLMYGIALGMEHLSGQGVCHRDLAARNVLLDERLFPKISDFGFSRKLDTGKIKGKTQSSFGPIRWMAPECIQSQSYSETTDIWAYGCTVVEMLTGKLPYTYCFDSDSLADLALAIRDNGLNPLGDIQHLENENKIKPPTWLVSVLELCFEQNPADRPSFAELCAMIQEKNPLLSVRFQNEAEDSKRLVSEPSVLPEHLLVSEADKRRGSQRRSSTQRGKTLKIGDKEELKGASDVKIVSRLGAGSFGAVFLGQLPSGRFVAVKQLSGDAVQADLHKEAAIMSALPPHPNLVQMFGLIADDEKVNLLMEFVPKGSLESFVGKYLKIRKEKIPELIMFRFAINIAKGMACLSANKVCHRDLSARNVLLDSSLEPKISDFGLSRHVVDSDVGGKTSTNSGPIRWMSPESLKDLVYNEKTDVWSYGCTAYEIVFGQTPFEGIDLVTVVNRVRDHHSTPLDERPSDSDPPAWMWKLMEMCFEFNPQKRPTFKEIIEYLGQNAPQQVLAVEKRLERNRKKREKILQAIQDITV